MQRSPPTNLSTPQVKYSSNPDLPEFVRSNDDSFINMRKRKQPEDEITDSMVNIIEKTIEKKMNSWKNELDSTISSAIQNSVQSIIEREVKKMSLSINNSLKELNERFGAIEKSLEFTIERQDTLEKRLDEIENNLKVNSSEKRQIQMLQDKMDAMEQQARSYNIEIANLPERRGENLLAVIEKLGCVIKHPINIQDVVSIHRVPHMENTNKRPKNVIVRFTTKITRDSVIAAARATKGLKSDQLLISGTVQNVYINEHLTAKNKQLFRSCREEAKTHNYKYVWIKNGAILVRQTDTSVIFAVRNEQDIKKIKSQN
ncbi:hypothetical protein ABMA27_003102 [Loxostege sticticalis]|uniref:FP protein C-terminal domain-containing protein n=1 Tax=Loxostege sticticalis TaxID=481309 RepID=A0ABR3HRY9_LOXSC